MVHGAERCACALSPLLVPGDLIPATRPVLTVATVRRGDAELLALGVGDAAVISVVCWPGSSGPHRRFACTASPDGDAFRPGGPEVDQDPVSGVSPLRCGPTTEPEQKPLTKLCGLPSGADLPQEIDPTADDFSAAVLLNPP